MNGIKQKLELVEQKQKRFKQQQFTFIAALERSREHARHRTEPVSSVAQVQRYMSHHCNNATDKRIFTLFIDIVADLEAAFQILDSSASALNYTSEALDTCRKLLSPDCNISHLRAQYPHDEVNRLSCNEALNYYGGVVSVIPLVLDLLKVAASALKKAGTQTPAPTPNTGPDLPTAADNTGSTSASLTRKSATLSAKSISNSVQGCKPAWKPPGCKRK